MSFLGVGCRADQWPPCRRAGLRTATSTSVAGLAAGAIAPGSAPRRLGQRARPFVGDGAGGVLEPARVAVVAALLVAAHLDDAEHAAHLDRAERALAAHHRGGVVGQRHLHLGHVGHAALAHHHVVGDQPGDLRAPPGDGRRRSWSARRGPSRSSCDGSCGSGRPSRLPRRRRTRSGASGRPRRRSSPRASASPSASGRRRCRSPRTRGRAGGSDGSSSSGCRRGCAPCRPGARSANRCPGRCGCSSDQRLKSSIVMILGV